MNQLSRQYQNDPDDDLTVSITKLVGKRIKDIECYIGDPYGGGAITNLTRLIFEDDTQMNFEGEHDVAYLSTIYEKNPRYVNFLEDLEDLKEEDEEELASN